MAAQTAKRTQHATLSTTVADDITFSAIGGSLIVTNHAAVGGANLYFRMDGTTAVSLADETYVVLPQQSKVVPYQKTATGTTVVSVVGNANVYSVELI